MTLEQYTIKTKEAFMRNIHLSEEETDEYFRESEVIELIKKEYEVFNSGVLGGHTPDAIGNCLRYMY